MKPNRPARNSRCPLCGNVPEAKCFSRTSHPFVWNGMLKSYICAFCNVELAIEFYEPESRYFDAAAQLLGVDVWQCRKRYLDDIILHTERQLAAAKNEEEISELRDRAHGCRTQLAAIERFMAVKSGAGSELESHRAWREVWQALAEPAFGPEVALPNLIAIQID